MSTVADPQWERGDQQFPMLHPIASPAANAARALGRLGPQGKIAVPTLQAAFERERDHNGGVNDTELAFEAAFALAKLGSCDANGLAVLIRRGFVGRRDDASPSEAALAVDNNFMVLMPHVAKACLKKSYNEYWDRDTIEMLRALRHDPVPALLARTQEIFSSPDSIGKTAIWEAEIDHCPNVFIGLGPRARPAVRLFLEKLADEQLEIKLASIKALVE